MTLEGFTDASWANSVDRKSISGYCFRMSERSSLISWKTKKQGVVALSRCESEYIALAFAVQEATFLQQLIREISNFSGSVHMNVDNMGTIDLSKNPVHHQRSKHIDTRFHFVRFKIADGSVQLQYVPSKENIADIFTKPCSGQALRVFAVVKPMK